MSMLMFAAALYAPQSLATEPLHDHFMMGEASGYIFPEKCCWVPVPRSERRSAVARSERCSAIGGPVGRYELNDGKLWLRGFETCGRKYAVKEFYPEFDDPAQAVWLNGKFNTKLGFLCMNYERYRQIFAREQVLVVERGVVMSVTETTNDRSACTGKAPQPPSS